MCVWGKGVRRGGAGGSMMLEEGRGEVSDKEDEERERGMEQREDARRGVGGRFAGRR